MDKAYHGFRSTRYPPELSQLPKLGFHKPVTQLGRDDEAAALEPRPEEADGSREGRPADRPSLHESELCR